MSSKADRSHSRSRFKPIIKPMLPPLPKPPSSKRGANHPHYSRKLLVNNHLEELSQLRRSIHSNEQIPTTKSYDLFVQSNFSPQSKYTRYGWNQSPTEGYFVGKLKHERIAKYWEENIRINLKPVDRSAVHSRCNQSTVKKEDSEPSFEVITLEELSNQIKSKNS